MVRSTGSPSLVDRDALRAHPAERHVRGADAVRPQDDLVERSPATHPHRDRTVGTDRGARDRAVGSQDRAVGRSEASRTAASAQPAARNAVDVGGPATSTSSTSSPGATDAMASAMPDVRSHAHARRCRRPGHRRRSVAASAPSRTTSSRLASTRTGLPYRSARLRATSGSRAGTLPPKAPPLASGAGRFAPGQAPRARPARGSRAPPRWCAACGPTRPGAARSARSEARSTGGPAPWPPPLVPRRASRPRPTHRPPPAPPRGRPAERCRRRSHRGRGRHVGADQLRGTSFERRPAAPQRPGRGQRDVTGQVADHQLVGLLDRLPAGAPAKVGEQGLADRRAIRRPPPSAAA